MKAGPHRVVVVGGGFGGLQAVRGLRRAPVEVTLVDRRNFHLFQPLLYQVATGALTAGAGHAYFGHDAWQPLAPGLKSLEDATEIRRRILAAFEAAELEPDADRRRAWLTFVVVGGGPTGVEMAGQIAEIARDTLRRDFRTIDPRGARILLVDPADRVPTAFPERLSGASGLAAALGEATGASVDRAGRVGVGPDLSLSGHPEVLAIGDMVRVHDADGRPRSLPGVAPAAMQEGRYAAEAIRARLRGRERRPFHYIDKGNVATIGRLKAVVEVKGLQLSGSLAWLAYLFVHLFYLVGLQSRMLVFIRWVVSFVTRGRGARLITEDGLEAGVPAESSDASVPARAA